MSKTRLIWSTPKGEELIVYMARVSSQRSEEEKFEEPEKLIKYLIKNKHWSPFEMANMCVELHPSRVVSAQILRHNSMRFQEFSQRYADAPCFVSDIKFYLEQDAENRQVSSEEEVDPDLTQEIYEFLAKTYDFYKKLRAKKVSKETARYVLPMGTESKMYINGMVRSWIHYFQQRVDADHVQPEHLIIATDLFNIFEKEYPIIAEVIKPTLKFNK